MRKLSFIFKRISMGMAARPGRNPLERKKVSSLYTGYPQKTKTIDGDNRSAFRTVVQNLPMIVINLV
jgi:hypothetical protein